MKHERFKLPGSFESALPLQPSRAELRKGLTWTPQIRPSDRSKSPATRLNKLKQLWQFYVPTEQQLRFAADFDCMLRAGYAFRDEALREAIQIDLPAVETYLSERFAEMEEVLATVQQQANAKRPTTPTDEIARPRQTLVDPLMRMSTAGIQMSLLGIPSMGKSRTIDRLLALYPQVAEREHMSPQVVWLKLPCPQNGDLTAFCRSFFVELDRALKRDCYAKLFAHDNAAKGNMPGHVQRLANIHSLGVLVVDDIEQLGAPSSDTKGIWHLLKHLSSNVGVPVVTAGTMAAAEHITSSASAAFRNVGLGSDCWMKLPRGAEWQRFIAMLWEQQWTNPPTPLTGALSETMYECCQGVVGLAVKLFHRVQFEVIRANADLAASDEGPVPEILTPEMISWIFEQEFTLCHEQVEALRSGDERRLRMYPDLRPLRSIPAPKPVEPAKPATSEGQDKSADNVETKEQAKSPDGQQSSSSSDEGNAVVQMARLIMEQSSVPKERQDVWVHEISTDIDHRFDSEAREFMRRIEARIRAWQRTEATWRIEAKGAKKAGDLRKLLSSKEPVIDVLDKAGLSGRSLFTRR